MASKDDQEWFRKFYEGTFLIQGWESRMKELLKAIPDGDREGMNEVLANLGEKIGREWAKENSVRRIDNSMLQKWGEDLRSAKKQGAEVLVEEIRRVDTEVDRVLA